MPQPPHGLNLLCIGHKTLEMTRRYTQELKIEEALEAMDNTDLADRLGLR